MEKDFQDKVVVVTGGAGDIGAAAARLLDRRGAVLVLLDLDRERGDALAAELGSAEFLPLDVSDSAAVDAVFAHVDERYGRVDGTRPPSKGSTRSSTGWCAAGARATSCS